MYKYSIEDRGDRMSKVIKIYTESLAVSVEVPQIALQTDGKNAIKLAALQALSHLKEQEAVLANITGNANLNAWKTSKNQIQQKLKSKTQKHP